MAFLSPRALKNRFQKKKLGRTKNAPDVKPTIAYSSQRTTSTSLGDCEDSLRSSPIALEGKPQVVPPNDYGYEDATPDIAARKDPFGYELHDPSPGARPRRSSMKGSSDGPRVTRRRHSISFDNEVQVNEVVPITTMLKNKGDVWLQGKDYYKTINKVNTIVDQAASGKGQKYCVRGLEHMIQGKDDRNVPRTEAWDTVLDEQYSQQASGDYDEEVLSRKYRSCSNQSRRKAKQRALQDEQDVAMYLKETRRYCRRMSM